ncbi:MAG: methyltransferase domain-containing protein [Turicibacter sp.]|nr:methyltransferase domain-containing protein [Turicibacter sp.]
MFESRRRIFTAGFYDQLTAALAEIIAAYAPEGVINVLDAGCGEGFFTTQLSGGSKAARNVFAVDIEKEAVKLAARFATGAKCFVADLAQLPLQTGTMDVVINVFSPARYEEFGRVLKRGGLIVKVVPQAFYLAELRDVVKGQLAKGAYSNADVLALFEKNLDVLAVRRVRYTLPVTSEQVADFAGMTPMLFHLDSEQVNLGAVSEMTIDVDVLVGRFGV